METWKKLEGYQFILWNRQRFDINSVLWVKQAFEAKKYAFAADYIRLYAVYTMGGIYLDMDVEVIKPFDGLLDKNVILAYCNKEKEWIEAACLGAEKGHFYFKKCLDYYINRPFIKPDGTYDELTLPRIMKNVFDELFISATFTLYSYDYFTATGKFSGDIQITNNTYCVHHAIGGWLSKSEIKYKKFRKKYRKATGRIIGNIISLTYLFMLCLKNNEIKVFTKIIKDIVVAYFKRNIR
jgi:mannosyltransferase OCH1-like enzyme